MITETPCEEVREELSAFLDNELGPETKERIETHLRDCSDCLRSIDRFAKVDRAYGQLGDVPIPDDLHDAILRAVREDAAPIRAQNDFHVRRYLAAAAVLVVVVGVLSYSLFLQTSGLQENVQMAQGPSGADRAERAAEVAEQQDAARQLEALGYLGGQAESAAAPSQATPPPPAAPLAAPVPQAEAAPAPLAARSAARTMAADVAEESAFMADAIATETVRLPNDMEVFFTQTDAGYMVVAPEEAETRSFGGRDFVRVAETWIERMPAPSLEAVAQAEALAPDSEQWQALRSANRELDALESAERPVLFLEEGRWYCLVP